MRRLALCAVTLAGPWRASASARDLRRGKLRKNSLLVHSLALRPARRVRNERPSFEAFTDIASRVRPSSAAICSAGIFPAMALSLATSFSVHARLDSGIRNTPQKHFK